MIYLYLSKLSGGVVLPSETNTGLVFLDSDTAKLFLDTSSRFEGDDEAQKIVERRGVPGHAAVATRSLASSMTGARSAARSRTVT